MPCFVVSCCVVVLRCVALCCVTPSRCLWLCLLPAPPSDEPASQQRSNEFPRHRNHRRTGWWCLTRPFGCPVCSCSRSRPARSSSMSPFFLNFSSPSLLTRLRPIKHHLHMNRPPNTSYHNKLPGRDRRGRPAGVRGEVLHGRADPHPQVRGALRRGPRGTCQGAQGKELLQAGA